MDELRKRVKLLKALQGYDYKEIAEYMELPPMSFYAWLNGHYEFSPKRKAQLEDIITTLYYEV